MRGSGIVLAQTQSVHFEVTATSGARWGPDLMTCEGCGLSWDDPTWRDHDADEVDLLRSQVDQARDNGSAGRLSELADNILQTYLGHTGNETGHEQFADAVERAGKDGTARRLKELTDQLPDEIDAFEHPPALAREKRFRAKAAFEAEFAEGPHEIMTYLVEGKDDMIAKTCTIPPGDDRTVTREWLVDTLTEAGLQSPHFGTDVIGSIEDFEVSMSATNGVRQTVFIEAGTPTGRIPPFLVTMAEELDVVDDRFGDATGRFNSDSENIWRRHRPQEKFLNPQRIESNTRKAEEPS